MMTFVGMTVFAVITVVPLIDFVFGIGLDADVIGLDVVNGLFEFQRPAGGGRANAEFTLGKMRCNRQKTERRSLAK